MSAATRKYNKTADGMESLKRRYVYSRPDGPAKFAEACHKYQLAVQLQELRESEGLTQSELAKKSGTSRTVITRIESANYEGHSLTTLRRVAGAMGYSVRIAFEPLEGDSVKEDTPAYGSKKKTKAAPRKKASASKSKPKKKP